MRIKITQIKAMQLVFWDVKAKEELDKFLNKIQVYVQKLRAKYETTRVHSSYYLEGNFISASVDVYKKGLNKYKHTRTFRLELQFNTGGI